MIALELHTRDILAIYERFAREIGERSWTERVSSVRQEIKGNPFLQRHHLQESAIAFQLEQLRELQQRFGGIAVMAYNDHSHYPAASFATQVLSVIDASNRTLADRFRAQVRAGLRTNPADLRALRPGAHDSYSLPAGWKEGNVRTLKDSASTQFTGQRAGMMVAGLEASNDARE